MIFPTQLNFAAAVYLIPGETDPIKWFVYIFAFNTFNRRFISLDLGGRNQNTPQAHHVTPAQHRHCFYQLFVHPVSSPPRNQ